jgi:serine protease Do
MKKRITVVSSLLVIVALLVSCAPATTQANAAKATQAAAPTQASATVNLTTVQEQDAYEQIYSNVNPSVVNIRVVEKASASTSTTDFTFPNIPGFQFTDPNQQQQDSVTQVIGAGFIYNKNGYIITNNHVVENADRIVVTFADGTEAEAKLIGTDVSTDLAVIQVTGVDSSLIKPVALGDSSSLKVGQIVIAIGSPFELQGTMTTGIVSALGRTMASSDSSSSTYSSSTSTTGYYSIPDIIQTDAAINHGNSGGPLLDLSGQVIGVNTAIESTSDSNAGIGYAIPSKIVKLVADTLIASGQVEHTYLGISTLQMTSDIAKAMNISTGTRGILVEDVSASGPAGKAGLKGSSDQVTIDGATTNIGGDVVVSIDGQPIKTYNDLISYLLLNTKAGQTVALGILRDGKETTINITLQARPASNS